MNEKDFIPPQLNLDVTYPKDIETCPNTFHGTGPKGNILLKIDGAKRVGRGILLAQNSDDSEDILKCRSKLVHITPEAYPLEDAQSVECFDAKTGEKYCFIGVYVQKSAGQHPAESIKSSSATALDTLTCWNRHLRPKRVPPIRKLPPLRKAINSGIRSVPATN